MNPSPRPLPSVRKIAVLRANGIGDLVFALPALAALRAAYPAAEMTLLAGDWQETFLAGRGVVDRVIAVPPSEGIWRGEEDPRATEDFFARMRAEHFDLALQLHGGGRYSNPFLRRLEAKVTAGLRTPDSEALDIVVPYVYLQHEVMRYLEVAAAVGAPPLSFEPLLPVLPADLEEAEEFVPEIGSPVVALNPGATDPRRRWPAACFAATGDHLAAAGAQVVVLGGAEDHDTAGAIVTAMKHPAVCLAGRLSLNGLAGMLSRCAVVVSNDSGPLHLAAAVGAATVGIYWSVNMVNAQPCMRTRHRPVVSWQMTCPACGMSAIGSQCEHEDSLVEEVEVEEVVYNALDLLRQGTAG